MSAAFSTASSSQIQTSAGATSITNGPATMAAVVRSVGFDNNRARICTWGAAGTNFSLDKSATDLIEWTDTPTSTLNIKIADGWVLVACTKATGTVAPRFHKYVYSTRVWAHENGGTTVANLTASGTVFIGASAASTLFWNGDIAQLALWNVVLTDVQIESLATDLAPANWNGYTRAVFLGRPSAASFVDLSGGGANQTSATGITNTVDEFPLLLPQAHPLTSIAQEGMR